MYKQNKRLLKQGSQFSINTQIQHLFSTKNNQNNNNDNRQRIFKQQQLLLATIATGLALGYNLSTKERLSQAENQQQPQNQQQKSKLGGQQQQEQKEPLKSEEGQLFSSVFRKTLDQFEIPKLLAEREKQTQQDYESRDETVIEGLEPISQEEFEEMKELDKKFGIKDKYPELTQEEKIELERSSYIQDPFVRQEQMKMKHLEYRTIKIGPHDLLKNGQMIQVSVCDPFDENKFHPTDKIIVMKHNNQYFATGAFCGFDYTNLGTGAFLGEKLICPTCGSTYNIQNGFVDQGPSLRNISSFLVQNREEKVQVVIPEHVPAFALKEFIKKSIIDPRTYVIIGDSETALSAIDALRSSFTGKIVCIPCSSYGGFENIDILNRSFTPLQKNQIYYVEEDYMDRANVEILMGEVSQINFNNMKIVVRGQKKPIEFDKVLIAWGSYKKRLNSANQTSYSNVYYLEDRFSHAKCHNELIKAKSILVMGGTFEAYQTAASVREYLDSIGYNETEIFLMDSQVSEVQQAFGLAISKNIHDLLKKQRISVIMDADIQRFQGIDNLEAIYFKKKNQPQNEKNVEYFIKPDLIIAENGIGAPKMNLEALLTPDVHAETNEPPLKVGIDQKGIPSSDIKFSLHYNDIHSPVFAAGSCTSYPSFLQKHKIRTDDVKYNIESGFFAAMNMLDKRVEFRYIPMTSMKIGETPIYFVGERNQPFHEIIVNGDVENNKYVVFFVYGKEVTGFVTVGYQNLHLFLWEAMKLLIMPAASQLRSRTLDYKDIVKAVLRSRPFIKCKRHDIIGVPSVMLAESEQELEKSQELSRKVKENIANENEIQKQKFQELKQKYDREGVEFIGDEMEMLDEDRSRGGQQNKARTRRGNIKPGSESSGYDLKTKSVNMGGADSEKNPFSALLNMAKGNFKD